MNTQSMVALELTYLHEISRLMPAAEVILDYLSDRLGLQFCDLPFEQVIVSAMKQTRMDRICMEELQGLNLQGIKTCSIMPNM